MILFKKITRYLIIQLQTRLKLFRPKNFKLNGKLRISFDSYFDFDKSSDFILQGDLFIKKSTLRIAGSEVFFRGGNIEGSEVVFINSQININKFCQFYYSNVNIDNSKVIAGDSFRVRNYDINVNNDSTLLLGDYNLFNKNPYKDGFINLNNSIYNALINNKIEACIACLNSKFTIGSNVFLNSGSDIICNKEITIGSNVFVSYETVIIDNNSHSIEPKDRLQEMLNGFPNGTLQTKELMPRSQPINIGNDVWIGMRSGILKGTTIGNNAIVAFNSVVNGNIPDDTLAYGNPFRTKKMEFKKTKFD